MKRQTYSWNPETRRVEWWYRDEGVASTRPGHRTLGGSIRPVGGKTNTRLGGRSE